MLKEKNDWPACHNSIIEQAQTLSGMLQDLTAQVGEFYDSLRWGPHPLTEVEYDALFPMVRQLEDQDLVEQLGRTTKQLLTLAQIGKVIFYER